MRNEIKSSRIYVKRPFSTTNFLPNNSATNGLSNHFKKRGLQINHFFNSKIKPFRSNEQTNGHTNVITHHLSFMLSLQFHLMMLLYQKKQTDIEQKVRTKSKLQIELTLTFFFQSKSPASRRIANVFCSLQKSRPCQSTRGSLTQPIEWLSEYEENPSKCHQADVDADESDNGNSSQLVKFRRFQKTRKSSNASLPTEN